MHTINLLHVCTVVTIVWDIVGHMLITRGIRRLSAAKDGRCRCARRNYCLPTMCPQFYGKLNWHDTYRQQNRAKCCWYHHQSW